MAWALATFLKRSYNRNMPSKLLIIITVFILFFSAFLFLLIGKMLLPEKEIIFDQTNKIFVIKGDVKIKKAKGDAAWQKMDASAILEKGDVVETAEGATVDITIGGNAEKSVKVEGKSRVEFEGINPTALNFSKGKVLLALKKLEPKSSFTVKTPTAICGARGTGWSEETDGINTKVCVFENSIYAREVDARGRPGFKKHTVEEGTQRILQKNKPISGAQKIGGSDQEDWRYWNKNVSSLREGRILVNDFDGKDNYNNLGGPFGSWNIFYSDPNQHCKDELTSLEKTGDKGNSLKLDYDVDSPYSAYNGFFTNLMGIDISDYKYLIFSIKGDKEAGFTSKINIELKSKAQIGKMTVEGITDEWKRIVIPLNRFSGIGSFKDMKELVIVFSDLNVTKKAGVIYIDGIYFAKTEPAA